MDRGEDAREGRLRPRPPPEPRRPVSRPGRRALLAAALLAVGAAGCGYALVGAGRGSLPEDVGSVWVETFVNDTPRVGLEQRVTEAVLRELSARARLKAARNREEADAVLSGRLLSYTVAPVRFDEAGRALEYEISMTARATLLRRSDESKLFEAPSFLFRQPYPVPPAASYVDVEGAAATALARPFAQSLVTTILEGF
ncbi:MAG: hypothetical protein EDX89_08270 [Acidobacteria bacterium]|nr:MAG: hypothetical protein EDX89_08270 [Acidobacteriota bacterium]MCE7958948.1 hypothetical protein [Acidobacteria bacterium ACB2]